MIIKALHLRPIAGETEWVLWDRCSEVRFSIGPAAFPLLADKNKGETPVQFEGCPYPIDFSQTHLGWSDRVHWLLDGAQIEEGFRGSPDRLIAVVVTWVGPDEVKPDTVVSHMLMTSGTVYILSDEGKTVDRVEPRFDGRL